MTAEEVFSLIEAEFASVNTLPRPFELLKPPQRGEFISDTDGAVWDLWLILNSPLGMGRGYKIVFDEQSRQFGIATAPSVFVGFWGSFAQTLDALLGIAQGNGKDRE
jgi:hypothetical protein